MDFKHVSVLLNETIDGLNINPDGIYVDGTLGGGGHSYEICKRLSDKGRLIGIDQDGEALEAARERLKEFEDKITLVRSNYCEIDTILKDLGIEKVDGIVLDLGVSSYQLDNLERGFSYKNEGPLDLRLDPSKGEPASERLKKLTKDEFTGMLIENSDEPYAKEIATEVFNEFRKKKEINTTTDLYKAIEKALSFIPEKERKDAVKKSSQRTFQALRIDVNSEFEVLEEFLQKLPYVMKEGGRIAILTFHSGEDRLVKQYFKMYKRDGVLSEISDVIRPSAAECARNGRARSTKLRWAVR